MITCSKDTFIASGSGAFTLHAGSGKILAIMVTTTNAVGQTVTIYDNMAASGDVLMTVNTVAQAPVYWVFPHNVAPRFTAGLTVDPGNCDVLLATAS